MPKPRAAQDALSDFNTAAWRQGDYVAAYSREDIAVVEAILVARHRDELRGPVLELGCGAGRVTRLLAALSDEVLAVDVSPAMVEACRRNVPEARVEVADLRGLDAFAAGSAGAVVGANNILDIFGPEERSTAFAAIHRILREDGLLLFSTHNLAHLAVDGAPDRLLRVGGGPLPRRVARLIWQVGRIPMRWRNRRRAHPLERSGPGWAVVNDGVHDHRLVMYYGDRDAAERELVAAGFALVACLDQDGRDIPAGDPAPAGTTLNLVARRR